jgi:hypothetical protein
LGTSIVVNERNNERDRLIAETLFNDKHMNADIIQTE